MTDAPPDPDPDPASPSAPDPAPPPERRRAGLRAVLAADANLRGMALMFVSTIAFGCMHAAIRYLSHAAATPLHPFEIAFFRNTFGLLVILPWFVRYGWSILHTRRPALHGLRALLNVVAMMSFFYALSITPLTQVAALAFTAPIFATVLAMLVLRETVRLRRWAAILFGFAGTFVAIRPGFAQVELGQVLVLAQAITWAAALICIKSLSRTDSSITIAAYMVVLMMPLSLGPAILVWRTPGVLEFVILAGIGIVGTSAQILMTQALKLAETTLVMPIDFFKMIWAAILGYALFAEVPDMFTWIGGAMIFTAATYIAFRENKLRRVAAPESVGRPPEH